MRTSSRIAAGLVAGIAVSLIAVAPAHADDTTLTATLVGGGLSISSPDSAAFNDVTRGGTAWARLFYVNVTDERGTGAAWAFSYSVTDFVSTTTHDTISADTFTYNLYPTDTTQHTSYSWALGSGRAASMLSKLAGNDIVTTQLLGDISVAIPEDAAAGTYTATLTNSVL